MRTREALVAAALCLFSCGPALSQNKDVRIAVDPHSAAGTSKLELGVTLIQTSFPENGNPGSVKQAMAELAASGRYVNQYIMGFGAGNPEPGPGQFDWSKLDARLAIIRKSGAIPVLTLCCAPDWMKGGAPGGTDWQRLAVAPEPEHFDDYVALVRAVAQRYPDVRHYQVWSELKGFWSGKDLRYDEYTEFYNKIFDALKAISPDIKVGGPYVVMAHWYNGGDAFHSTLAGPYGSVDKRALDAIEYWLAHKHGADFVVIDGGDRSRDGGLPDPFAAGALFSDASNWVRSKTSLPLWWAEWYATPYASQEPDDAQQSALMSAALIRMAPLVSVALRWAPEADPRHNPPDHESLWSPTVQAGGGHPYPAYFAFVGFRKCFPPGTPLVRVTSSSPTVAALASPTCAMVVNETSQPVAVSVNGTALRLGSYETKFVEVR